MKKIKMNTRRISITREISYRFIAVFMILLVISLPVYVSSAYADSAEASIVEYSATGKKGINGFVSASDDHIEITAIINYQNALFKSEYFRVFLDNKEYKAACTLQQEGGFKGYWKCSYKSLTITKTPGIVKYKLVVYDVAGLDLDTKEDKVVVDGMPPVAVITPKINAPEQKVTIEYSVEDKACDEVNDAECKGKCSGFESIKLLLNDKVIDEKTDFVAGICTTKETLEKTYAGLGITGTEVLKFCVEAVDKVGLKKKSCGAGEKETITISTTQPVFDDSSFTVLKDGIPFAYLKKAGDTAKLTILINATDDKALAKKHFKADFTALNPLKATSYKEKMPSGVKTYKVEDVTFYEAKWTDIELKNPEENPAITITATDDDGNAGTFEAALEIKYDSTPPSITAVYTDKGDFLNASDKNNIYIEFSESESGMSKENIFLDLSTINQNNNAKPDECTGAGGGGTGGTYVCVWKNLKVTTSPKDVYDEAKIRKYGEVIVQVRSETKDNAGNYIAADDPNKKVKLKYDKDAPEFLEVKVEPAEPAQKVISTSPDEIVSIIAVIKEEEADLTNDIVFADLSEIGLADGYAAASECIETDITGIYECRWDFAGIPEPGSYSVELIAFDKAGNIAEAKTPYFMVLEVKEMKEKGADYFEDLMNVDMADYKLNRNFLFMSQSTLMPFTFTLTQKKGKSFVHDFHLTECQADAGEIIGAAESEEIEGKGGAKAVGIVSESFSPSLKAGDSKVAKDYLIALGQFSPAELKNAVTVVVTCKGEIIQSKSKVSTLYKPNEAFTVEIIIGLGNAVFENPGERALDKAFSYETAIDTLDDIIDIIDFPIRLLSSICKFSNLIIQIKNNICMIIDGIAIATRWAPLISINAESSGSICKTGVDFLNKIWYGTTQTPEKPEDWTWTNKDVVSLGFWCDSVLCTTCSHTWDKLIGLPGLGNPYEWLGSKGVDSPAKAVAVNPLWQESPEEFWRGGEVKLPLDPTKNLYVALICAPPCLPTIKNNLELIKRILVAQNVCMNKVYTIGGNVEECGSAGWKIFCMLTIGQVAYMIPMLARMYVAKTAAAAVEMAFDKWCEAAGPAEARMYCYPKRIKAALVTITELMDMITNIKNMANLISDTFDFGKDSEDTDSVEKEFESARQKYYGDIPKYD